MRVKTLMAALVPPMAAHGLYFSETGKTSYYFMTLCILFAISIQIATNFYNDAVDFLKGADDQRVGPARITSDSGLTSGKVLFIGHLFIGCAFIFGIPLVSTGGGAFVVIALISMYLAYGYTGGPFPLAYLGLGELFVFLFFGLIATTGSYFLYAQAISVKSLLLGSQIGLLSCALIAINNFRDRKLDVKVNKLTIATRISDKNYLIMLDVFLFFPHFLLLFFISSKLSYFIPILSISFAHKARIILKDHKREEELNEALKLAGIHLLFFGVLFYCAGQWH